MEKIVMDIHPRKKIILAEAARLFRTKSYAAATLRELAKQSGIKGGSIYYHFSSKQEILYNVMDYTLTELTFRLREVEKNEMDVVKKLQKAIETHIVYHISNLNMTYVTDSEIRSLTNENYKDIIKKRKRYENLFIKILDEGIKTGQFDIKDSKRTTYAILQMCTGVSYWYKEGGPLRVEDVVEIYSKFAYGGLLGFGGNRTGM